MTSVRVPLLPAWLRWAGVAAVAAAIFYLSVVTTPPSEPIVEPLDLLPLDKWRHFLAYAAFAGCLVYAIAPWSWSTRRVAALVLGLTVAYGVGIEVWQAFVPDRYFSPADAYANALGALIASPLLALRDRVALVPVRSWVSALGSGAGTAE